MERIEKTLIHIFLFFLIVFFVFFTFYGLSWGSPFFFHPDERNIASAVTRLNPENFNPHFFAYGQLPIYASYAIGVFLNYFSNQDFRVNFDNAIIIGRFISSVFTFLLIFLIYIFTKKISSEKVALLALTLSLTSTAYLQYSHFSTFEILLSFFSLFSTYLFYSFLKNKRAYLFALGSFFLGILAAIKLSSTVLVILPIYSIVIALKHVKTKKTYILKSLKLLFSFILFFAGAYIIASPFNILDPKSFLASMEYEGGVAAGTLEVFYTGAFNNTVPIVYQYIKVLPFLLNPVITLISIPAIIFIGVRIVKTKDSKLGLIFLSFLVLFISGTILYVKWTRYLLPSLSFLYIFTSIFIFEIQKKVPKYFFQVIVLLIVVYSLIHAFSFIKTARLDTDTRLDAVNFALKDISSNANITSEVYDLGIVPFNPSYNNITLFNFYDLDTKTLNESDLAQQLSNTSYLILPSQRIIKSRIQNPDKFPVGHKFYSNLENNFKKIYQTPCDIFCRIVYIGDPVYSVEDTTNVFDRPTIFIYQKK